MSNPTAAERAREVVYVQRLRNVIISDRSEAVRIITAAIEAAIADDRCARHGHESSPPGGFQAAKGILKDRQQNP